ncbi:MAG: carbohydrate binding domain-containing protein, partial [Caldilineaceae bacterium]|nr:carbohydrate binding domain-containing protein [Caldilineaceae bacterium]
MDTYRRGRTITMGLVFVIFLIAWGQAPLYAQSGSTEIVSVASDGTPANGASSFPQMSADGRYVVFLSDASNLVANDTNGLRDCFLHDRFTGETTRVSVASDGTQGNGAVTDRCFISPNGRYVAFSSFATNLVDQPTSSLWSDAFVHDTQTIVTTLVSKTHDGSPANWPSSPGPLSEDGRYVTFWSVASNLLTNEETKIAHIYVYDQKIGKSIRVSRASNGASGNANSYGVCLSADGRYVAFGSYATNLVANDTNGLLDAFVRDLQTGITTRLAAGDQPNGVSGIDGQCLSGDGRYIAFDSEASNLVANDRNGRRDTFLYDQQSRQITRVSLASDGTESNGSRWLYPPTISRDGRMIGFESYATNLVPGDTNQRIDIFVHDRDIHQTTGASLSSWGEQGNQDSLNGLIAGDGRFVAFESDATNLVFADRNGVRDIFVHDRLGESNLLQNPGFESGKSPWKFWTDAAATFTVARPGYQGEYAAKVEIVEPGDNVQLYQKGFALEPKSYYRLEFSARSNTGHDVAVYL